MKRFEAIRLLRDALPADCLVTACNGMIGRELFSAGDRSAYFYMMGSMGLTASIGLGLALTQPSRTVLTLDGDGNVLMGLATLASIAAAGVSNFYHVVLDNVCHGSTGAQPTISDRVHLERIALAAGYRWARRAETTDEFKHELELFFGGPGPRLLLVSVGPENRPGIGRVGIKPPDLANRFKQAATGKVPS